MASEPLDSTLQVQAPLGGFECAICFELLCDPVQLQCRHAFCRSCLVASMNRGRQTAAGANLRCPLCRAEAPSGFDPVTAPAPLVRLMRHAFPQRYAQREAQQAEAAAFEDAMANLHLRLRIGNRHELVANPQMTKNGRNLNKHRWTMFVENASSDASFGDWTAAIASVSFKLTPYFPSDAVLRSPPFATTRVGWGYFDVKVTVTFKAGLCTRDRFEVEHELSFDDGGASEVHEIVLLRPIPAAAHAESRRLRSSRREVNSEQRHYLRSSRRASSVSPTPHLAGQRPSSSQGPGETAATGTSSQRSRPTWR